LEMAQSAASKKYKRGYVSIKTVSCASQREINLRISNVNIL